ncbi:hypothetical protein SY2F82_73400 [Streptomyces sp. Y2F8-2]|nr:hypothetical protein SY2F82_73400 [Streptomyces sp. Y2F8-2]
MAQAWRPGVRPWAVHALRAGGTAHVPVSEPRAFPSPRALDLPDGPPPVHTQGHTGGHCAYRLTDSGIHTDRSSTDPCTTVRRRRRPCGP